MLIYTLVIAAVLARFLPHLANFAPVTAAVLFAGAYIDRRRLWLPLAAIIASDFVLTPFIYHYPVSAAQYFSYGFPVPGQPTRSYPTVADQYFVWAAYLVILGLGLLLRRRVSAARVAGFALASSITFFVVSNFGTWFAGALYPRTIAGLGLCYTAAIPFYRNTLISDLLFSAVFFGSYELARRRGWVAAPAQA